MRIKKSNARRHHPLLWDPIYKYKKAVESELPKALYSQMIDTAIAGDEPVSCGRVTGIIPLSAMNTDGDVFMPGCWDKKGPTGNDAILAVADQILAIENKFRCQACGGIFEKDWTDEEARDEAKENFQKFIHHYMQCTVCDDCYKIMMEAFKPSPQPQYPPGTGIKLAHPSILWDHGFTHHEFFLKDISPAPQHGVSPIVTALPMIETYEKVQRLGFGRNPDGRNFGMGGTIDKEGHFNLTEISLIPDPGSEILSMQDELTNKLALDMAKRMEDIIKTVFKERTGDELTEANASRVKIETLTDYWQGYDRYCIDDVPVYMLAPVNTEMRPPFEVDNSHTLKAQRSIIWL